MILDHAFIGKHFTATHDDPRGLLNAYEEGIAAKVFEKLWADYPGYDWNVKVDARPRVGMCTIKIPGLMGPTFGWNFAIDKLANDPSMGIVKKAGGEILEHWKLRRSRANATEFREAKQTWRVMARKVNRINQHVGLKTPSLIGRPAAAPALLAA
jgi:hypothetical protein